MFVRPKYDLPAPTKLVRLLYGTSIMQAGDLYTTAMIHAVGCSGLVLNSLFIIIFPINL